MKSLFALILMLLLSPSALRADTKLYCHKILDQMVREQAQTNYSDSIYDTYEMAHSPYPIALSLRLELGDSHPEYLRRLGFQLIAENGRKKLIPPKNFEDVFMNIEGYFRKKIMEVNAQHEINSENENLTKDDVIWPSLVFIKKGVNPSKAKLNEFYLMRYGLDLQPDLKEYDLYSPKFAEALVFSPEIFTGFLVQGKMPLGLDDMIDHELGHFTEFMERPQLMKRIKRAAWLIYGLEIQAKKDFDQEFKRGVKNVAERFFYLMEFMAVPKIENDKLIKAHTSLIFENSKLESISVLREALKEKPVDEVFQMAKGLIINQYNLFYKMGGAHRDTYNSSQEVGKQTFRGESPLVLLLQIKRNMERLSKLGSLAKRTPEYAALIDQLSRVQMSLYAGLKYQITPEKLYDEMVSMHPAPKLDSVKYFASFSPPQGELYRFFVADN